MTYSQLVIANSATANTLQLLLQLLLQPVPFSYCYSQSATADVAERHSPPCAVIGSSVRIEETLVVQVVGIFHHSAHQTAQRMAGAGKVDGDLH